MLNEFKKFIARGNVVDLAVGVIIGSSFSAIVTSLVNNIFTPLIGIVFGGVDFSGLSFTIKDSVIMYGAFIQSVFDFLITALCLFIIVKIMNKLNSDIHRLSKKGQEEVKEEKTELPKKSDELVVLEEIRNLLQEKKKGKNK